ncbi:MAG: CPBP family intramembrane metalloprotease [Bacteroidales bacterium]|nr:CPBP family intramembrane metalloprotease [Bacteroidales bacterium]
MLLLRVGFLNISRKITNFYPAMRLQPIFRDLSSGSRFLLLVLVVLLSGILSLSLTYLFSLLFWGRDVFSSSGDPDSMNLVFMRFTQMFNQLGFFLLPPFLFAWLSEQSPYGFLGFTRPKNIHLLASILLIMVAGPFTGVLTEWNEMLRLPAQLSGIEEWIRSSEVRAARLTERIMNAPGVSTLAVNLVMIGLLTAMGEELLFRSALIGVFRKVFRGFHLPVIISAFVFSALHLQFFGFLPRFMLGLAFGYLFVWSGSVWVPITAHFINNASIVVASFLYNRGISSVAAEELGTSGSGLWIGSSVVACLVIMIWVYRTRVSPVKPEQIT